MKGVVPQPSFRPAQPTNRSPRTRDHGRARGEEVPARLAQLAALLDRLAEQLMDVACSIRRELKVESALRP